MRGISIIVAVFLCVFSMAASANAVSFGLDYEYTGATEPKGSLPWLSATFADKAQNTVELTMDATNLVESEFVGGWYFNVDETFVSSLSFLPIKGPTAFVLRGPNGQNAGGALGAGFDILFDFSQSNGDRLGAGAKSVYKIGLTDGSGFSAESFNLVNEPKNVTGTFYSAAHVQSIGSLGTGSGWIAAGESTAMPEPQTLLSLGLGMLGLGLVARKRFSR